MSPKLQKHESQKKFLTHYRSLCNENRIPNNSEGKVFLFKYGKKIHDKIVQAMQPEFSDEKPINPFDFWKGADFKLKIRKVAGYVNYDKSEFDAPSELFDGNDAKLEALWKKQYTLKEFTSTETHKSFEELKTRYDFIMGLSDSGIPRKASAEDIDT